MHQILGVILGAQLLAACSPPTPVVDDANACADGETCAGADDCYSRCYCETEKTSACERECGPRGTRIQDFDAADWPPEWAAFEAELLELVNDEREAGACCGIGECIGPLPHLLSEDSMVRAARAHAFDMSESGYVSHESLDGRSAFDRVRESGFRGCSMGENITVSQTSPEDALQAWLESPEHCANIMSERFARAGVGYYSSPTAAVRDAWVMVFGSGAN